MIVVSVISLDVATPSVSHLVIPINVTIGAGYRETIDIPRALGTARKRGLFTRNLDLENASFWVSRMSIVPTRQPGMQFWRKGLSVFMARNSSSPLQQFGLPPQRTVIMGAQIMF